MPRVVFGNLEELVNLVLANAEARTLFKSMQELQRNRQPGWYERYRNLLTRLAGVLAKSHFCVPLPAKGDNRKTKMFAVHYVAQVEGGQADSWDFALIPGGDAMKPEEIMAYLEGCIDNMYGTGFFKATIKHVVPVDTNSSLITPSEEAKSGDDLFDD